jgi:hypothetical protein
VLHAQLNTKMSRVQSGWSSTAAAGASWCLMHSLIVLLLLLPGPCAMLAIASQGIDSKALSSGVQSSLLLHRVALGASRHVCCELVVAVCVGVDGVNCCNLLQL